MHADLAARVEALTYSDHEVDAEVAEALGLPPKGYVRDAFIFWSWENGSRSDCWDPPHLTSDPAAVLALIEERWPGMWVAVILSADGAQATIGVTGAGQGTAPGGHLADRMARALLAAYLRSLP